MDCLECLWTSWNGLQCELNRFPQPFLCVGRSCKSWEELYWLLLIVYTLGILSGILLEFCTFGILQLDRSITEETVIR